MNSQCFFILILLTSLILFTNCKKDKDTAPSNPTNPALQAKMSAKVNGIYISTNNVAYSNKDGRISATGHFPNDKTISFLLDNELATTYITDVNSGCLSQYKEGSMVYNTTSNGEGWVTIRSIESEVVSGTFEFVAHNQDNEPVVLSEGSFENLSKTDTEPIIETPEEDHFNCTIDGNTFKASNISAISNQNTGILISVEDSNSNQHFSLNIPINAVVGTYTLSQISGAYTMNFTNSNNAFLIGSGTISITKHDLVGNRVVGRFECTAAPSGGGNIQHQITDGYFDVQY